MLKIVLDTNILLVSISSKSKYHWIFQALINHKIQLCISNEILNKYEEVIKRHWNSKVAKFVVRTLLELANVQKCDIYYNFNLITSDPDDNKFVDCAIAGNVNYIVSNDKHLKILKNIDFPKVNLLTINELELLKKDKC